MATENEALQKLDHPTPCRFHPEQRRQLVAAAKRFRMRPAELIRRAVDESLRRWDAGEAIVVHPNR
jgi:hypothetical protein